MLYSSTPSDRWLRECAEALAYLRTLLPWRQHAQSTVVAFPEVGKLSDEECMTLYQQGDATAFRTLYLRYRDKLHRFTLRLANRGSEAEEVFQEVWVTVIRSRHTYGTHLSFAAWLFSIAHRRAADRWRVLSRHAPDWQGQAEQGEVDLLEQHAPAVQHTPERQLHNEALRQALQDAVLELPLPQREAFLLKAEGDLSLEDIAAVTGVSRETVKSRLRYAQRRLREALEDWR